MKRTLTQKLGLLGVLSFLSYAAAVALCMMLVGAVGTKLVPAQYFGAVERFSVFAATGFNAAPFRQAILRHWSAAYEAFYLKSGQ